MYAIVIIYACSEMKLEPMSDIGIEIIISYVDGEINDVKMTRVEQNPYVCVSECASVCM